MQLEKKHKEIIVDLLQKKIAPWLIYLFGSSYQGRMRPDSDIDVAILSDNSLDAYQFFLIAQELAEALGREVDLIDLSQASTVFVAQVVGNSEILYCEDQIRKAYFELKAFKEYALLNEERQVVLERIKREGKIYG